MTVFIDNISSIGDARQIRKRIRNCRKMEILKKFEYGQKKTKSMVVKTGKQKVEQIDGRI